jgi:hypothetical protein
MNVNVVDLVFDVKKELRKKVPCFWWWVLQNANFGSSKMPMPSSILASDSPSGACHLCVFLLPLSDERGKRRAAVTASN